MKITTSQLRRIIREELMNEATPNLNALKAAADAATAAYEKASKADQKERMGKANKYMANGRDASVFKQTDLYTDKGAGSGSQVFGKSNPGKEIKLGKVKPGMPVRVSIYVNGGAGSGSEYRGDIDGFVKKLDGDLLRIILPNETGNKSKAINIRSITKIKDLTGVK